MYKTRKLFYLQKVYIFFKGLLIYKIIPCWNNVVFQAPHLIEKSKTFIKSNILR